MPENPISVLIDNCVDGYSDVMEGARKPVTLQWGDIEINEHIVGYQRKQPRKPNEAWLQTQIDCLPTVARLAQEGGLVLASYSEIRFEGFQRSGGFVGSFIGRLFQDVDLSKVSPAIERSRLYQMEFGSYIQRSAMIEFCEFLLELDEQLLLGTPKVAERFPEFELTNIRHLERFRALCRGLGKKQYPDAFHLWTGEVNGVDYFLTTDKKFIRAMTESKNVDLPCKPISPEVLLKELGITERDEYPFDVDQFYSIDGVSE
ncbi:hypothetical protein ACFL12_00420 [Pseudomonadota bacterium]